MEAIERGERIAKTYVWAPDGTCYFVSTADRDSSAPGGDRYAETLVWGIEWPAGPRGALMPWTEYALQGSLYGHHQMVERIHATGSGAVPDDEDDQPMSAPAPGDAIKAERAEHATVVEQLARVRQLAEGWKTKYHKSAGLELLAILNLKE